jgi:hypothetical protein
MQQHPKDTKKVRAGASTDSPVDNPNAWSFSYPPDADRAYPYSMEESMEKKCPFSMRYCSRL